MYTIELKTEEDKLSLLLKLEERFQIIDTRFNSSVIYFNGEPVVYTSNQVVETLDNYFHVGGSYFLYEIDYSYFPSTHIHVIDKNFQGENYEV